MEIDTLRNKFLQISIKRLGAELTSITDADGTEYLWQADPLVWAGQSPLLFPIVGKLAGDSYAYAGKSYTLPQHGFARRKVFRPAGKCSDGVSYSLGPDESTYENYPFDFSLEVSYRLDGTSIHVGYRVTNLDRKPLPFSLGGHPGFSCTLHPGDELEDYRLEFEKEEIADTCLVMDGLIAVSITRRILSSETTLPLTKTLFNSGALVLMNLKSSAVTLRSQRHPTAVKVDFPGFPCLGIWSKPAAPFVCIEPWFGHADPAGMNPGSPLETKPGIIIMPPGHSFECAWRVTITS